MLHIRLDLEAHGVAKVEPAGLLKTIQHVARGSHHPQIDVLRRPRASEAKLENEPALRSDGFADYLRETSEEPIEDEQLSSPPRTRGPDLLGDHGRFHESVPWPGMVWVSGFPPTLPQRVPSLLIDQETGDTALELHAGTMDLDIGLAAALLDQGRYREISDRLRRSGFAPDENETGRPIRQRWKSEAQEKVTVDFLMPPISPDDRGGSLRDLELDFAAVIAPGLQLAFRDRMRLSLSGQTIVGEDATRDIWVCGPGAFVVLKALAFDLRGENKDAYYLFYVLRNYGASLEDVVESLRPLLDDEHAMRAIEILRRDFLSDNGVGPRRVAAFRTGGPDEAIQADVVGFVGDLLRRLGVSE